MIKYLLLKGIFYLTMFVNDDIIKSDDKQKVVKDDKGKIYSTQNTGLF